MNRSTVVTTRTSSKSVQKITCHQGRRGGDRQGWRSFVAVGAGEEEQDAEGAALSVERLSGDGSDLCRLMRIKRYGLAACTYIYSSSHNNRDMVCLSLGSGELPIGKSQCKSQCLSPDLNFHTCDTYYVL